LQREYRLFLEDILKAIARIEGYVGNREKKAFLSDQLLVDATLRNLEIIGEAAGNIPEAVQRKHPKVPWRDVKNFRNTAIHKYWVVDEEILWDIVENELSPLKKQIRTLLD